jgi:hypothetical protein
VTACAAASKKNAFGLACEHASQGHFYLLPAYGNVRCCLNLPTRSLAKPFRLRGMYKLHGSMRFAHWGWGDCFAVRQWISLSVDMQACLQAQKPIDGFNIGGFKY